MAGVARDDLAEHKPSPIGTENTTSTGDLPSPLKILGNALSRELARKPLRLPLPLQDHGGPGVLEAILWLFKARLSL